MMHKFITNLVKEDADQEGSVNFQHIQMVVPTARGVFIDAYDLKVRWILHMDVQKDGIGKIESATPSIRGTINWRINNDPEDGEQKGVYELDTTEDSWDFHTQIDFASGMKPQYVSINFHTKTIIVE